MHLPQLKVVNSIKQDVEDILDRWATLIQPHMSKSLNKAGPPGAPPQPHLRWKEETHRWVCRNDKCESFHEHAGPDWMAEAQKMENETGLASVALHAEEDYEGGFVRALSHATRFSYHIRDMSSYVDEVETHAVSKYVGRGYYRMNRYLRGGAGVFTISPNFRQEDADNVIADVKAMSDHMVAFDTPQIVYRGVGKPLRIDDDEPLKVGSMLDIDTFLSTTRNPFIAEEFSSSHTFIELHVPIGVRGMTLHTNEHETILDYGQRMRIEEIRYEARIPRTKDIARAVDTYIVATILPADESQVREISESSSRTSSEAGTEVERGNNDCEVAHDHWAMLTSLFWRLS